MLAAHPDPETWFVESALEHRAADQDAHAGCVDRFKRADVDDAVRLVHAEQPALDVVAALGLAGRPLAVEVTEEVVPRARLAACMLKAGDRVEIVTLVGGG